MANEQHSKDIRHFYGAYGELSEEIYNIPAIGVNSPSVDRSHHNAKWMRRRFGGQLDAAPFTADAYFDTAKLPDLAATAIPGAAPWATVVTHNQGPVRDRIMLLAAYTSLRLSAQPQELQSANPVRTSMGFTPSDKLRKFRVPIVLQALPLAILDLSNSDTFPKQFESRYFGSSNGQDGLILIVVIESYTGTFSFQLTKATTTGPGKTTFANVANHKTYGISRKGVYAVQENIVTADVSDEWAIKIARTSTNTADKLTGWVWATRLAGERELV